LVEKCRDSENVAVLEKFPREYLSGSILNIAFALNVSFFVIADGLVKT
jgi:hypothetical protein